MSGVPPFASTRTAAALTAVLASAAMLIALAGDPPTAEAKRYKCNIILGAVTGPGPNDTSFNNVFGCEPFHHKCVRHRKFKLYRVIGQPGPGQDVEVVAKGETDQNGFSHVELTNAPPGTYFELAKEIEFGNRDQHSCASASSEDVVVS